MASVTNLTPANPSACADTARAGPDHLPSSTRRLTRDVVGVTAIKVVILMVIYALFFWGASHRMHADVVEHIAGAPPNSETR